MDSNYEEGRDVLKKSDLQQGPPADLRSRVQEEPGKASKNSRTGPLAEAPLAEAPLAEAQLERVQQLEQEQRQRQLVGSCIYCVWREGVVKVLFFSSHFNVLDVRPAVHGAEAQLERVQQLEQEQRQRQLVGSCIYRVFIPRTGRFRGFLRRRFSLS